MSQNTLSSRQKDIIKTIQEKGLVTSYIVSKLLSCGEKTVRNEVKMINSIYQDLILSVRGKGYCIEDNQRAKEILLDGSLQEQQRSMMLLKELLIYDYLDFYEIAEKFYISESTLYHDIMNINEHLLFGFNAVIVRNNNSIYLDVDELDKRKIYKYFAMQELEQYNFDLCNYTGSFNTISLKDVEQFIVTFMKENNIVCNDFEIIGMIVHLAIAVDRVKANNILIGDQNDMELSAVASRFCDQAQEYFSISLDLEEKKYLMSIIDSRASDHKIKEHVEIKKLLEKIVQDIHEFYQLSLVNQEDFIESLYTHMISLEKRIKNKTIVNNPLTKDIKENFPLIYDISVFIAIRIQEHYLTKLNEQEIGFISLHVMNVFEKIRKATFKIAIFEITSNKGSLFYERKLTYYFPQYEFKVQCFSIFSQGKLSLFQPDIIIKTSDIDVGTGWNNVVCSSLFLEQEVIMLSQQLKKVQQQRENTKKIKSMMSEKFFYIKDFSKKEDLLHFVCNELEKEGYCDEHYINYIVEREKIAPTSFGSLFAIPHPTKKEALRPMIATVILKKPMNWSGQKVRLVFLFALTKEIVDIMEIYEDIISLVDDIDKVKQLIKQENYNDFISLLVSE